MENKTGDQNTRKQGIWPYLRQARVLLLSSLCIILLTSQVNTDEQLSGIYLGQQAPGTEPERFARGIIPDDLHSIPVFSSDGMSVYYKSMDTEGIMLARQMGNRWLPPKPLFMNDEVENSDDPCLSPSGDKLFFSSYSKNDNRDYIYYCEFTNKGLSKPQKPAGNLNELDLHWQFSLAGNGNLYYASNGNIYCSEVESGSYQDPYRLDSAINTSKSECTPYVSPEEDLLIFARTINGKPDLYISQRDEEGRWQAAIPLGSGINTEHHEMCPRITDDRKYFFFISSREGLFSAYWVDVKALGI